MDTGNRSVKRPCFLSDHIKPPCTEDRGNCATKWLPKWLGCEPRRIVLSLDSKNGSTVNRDPPIAFQPRFEPQTSPVKARAFWSLSKPFCLHPSAHALCVYASLESSPGFKELGSWGQRTYGKNGELAARLEEHRQSDVRTGSGMGPPRGKRAPRVGISSTVFGVMADIFRRKSCQ